MFMWLALHDRLPTTSLLYRQTILDDPLWSHCHQQDETADLLFFHCPQFARIRSLCYSPLWHLTQGSLPELLFNLPLNWIHQIRFIILVWVIWNSHNNKLFRGQDIQFDALHARCINLERELVCTTNIPGPPKWRYRALGPHPLLRSST